MNALDGPRLRLRFAMEGIAALERAIGAAIAQYPYPVVADLNSEPGSCIFKYKAGASADPVWGVRVGEILHNQRAALDEVAWQLAKRNVRRRPHKRTQFPICAFLKSKHPQKGAGYYNAIAPLQLADIAPKDRQCFMKQQPYHKRNGGRNDPLWLLKELNDSDKHHTMHVVLVAYRGFGISFTAPLVVTAGPGLTVNRVRATKVGGPAKPLTDGAELFRGRAGFAKHPECVKVDLQYEVHFGSTAGPAKNRQVIKTLTEIQDRVSGIIDSFAPLFPVRAK